MAKYKTRYGDIEYSQVPPVARGISQGKCVYDDPPFSKRHEDVKLQPAAIKAFREAEAEFGRRTIDQKKPRPDRRARAIRLTGIGWRDYDYQAALYASDSNRYAKPWVSGHVQGICIDVDTNQNNYEKARTTLAAIGWKQVRSDEPWHFSWGYLV